MRRALLTISLVLLMQLSAMGTVNEQNNKKLDILASRQVVGQVYFDLESNRLTDAAKETLSSMAPRLKQLLEKEKLIRVEGFSSPDGGLDLNVELSMERALTVKRFLDERYQLNVEVFLSGFGPKEITQVAPEQRRRVDIAIYDIDGAADLFADEGNTERFMIK